MSLRDCTMLAIAYFKSGVDFWPSIWNAIHAFEADGLAFDACDVAADWKLLKSKRRAARKTNVDNTLYVELLDDGRVKVSQAGVVVILLLEEAKEQYPFLFE